jgi:phage gpG-like protein
MTGKKHLFGAVDRGLEAQSGKHRALSAIAAFTRSLTKAWQNHFVLVGRMIAYYFAAVHNFCIYWAILGSANR